MKPWDENDLDREPTPDEYFAADSAPDEMGSCPVCTALTWRWVGTDADGTPWVLTTGADHEPSCPAYEHTEGSRR